MQFSEKNKEKIKAYKEEKKGESLTLTMCELSSQGKGHESIIVTNHPIALHMSS